MLSAGALAGDSLSLEHFAAEAYALSLAEGVGPDEAIAFIRQHCIERISIPPEAVGLIIIHSPTNLWALELSLSIEGRRRLNGVVRDYVGAGFSTTAGWHQELPAAEVAAEVASARASVEGAGISAGARVRGAQADAVPAADAALAAGAGAESVVGATPVSGGGGAPAAQP